MRDDIEEIVEECYRHTKRIVISTSGWYDSKVIELAKRFPDIGIRLSLEGMQAVNDELRGRSGGFEKGFNTLLTLRDMGVKDIGFGCTVCDWSSDVCSSDLQFRRHAAAVPAEPGARSGVCNSGIS